MGDPRKQRKKFEKPSHPWQKERIDEERKFVERYGLAKKKELWKALSILKSMKQQAKLLVGKRGDVQAEKESKDFLAKLYSLKLIEKDSKLEAVLELKPQAILDRRLQTLLVQQGLAKSIKQARQFIVHGHVTVKGKQMDVPSYLVLRDEESALGFTPNSSLNDPEHPERKVDEKKKGGKEETKKDENKKFMEATAAKDIKKIDVLEEIAAVE